MRTVDNIISQMEKTGIMMRSEMTNADRHNGYIEYQNLVTRLVFNDDHAQSLRLWDVIDHFKQLASEKGLEENPTVVQALKDMDILAKEIAGSIAGMNGEQQVARMLLYPNRHIIALPSVSLSDDIDRTEIDQIVITSNGILILEVKNFRREIVITETGKIQGQQDKTLGEQMNVKRFLLRSKLTEALKQVDPSIRLVIDSRVVFCDPNYTVRDFYHAEKYCHKAKLPYEIEQFRSNVCYTPAQMVTIADTIQQIADEESLYPIRFDFNQIRHTFAEALVLLEAEPSPSLSDPALESQVHDILAREEHHFPVREVATAISFLGIVGGIAVAVYHHKKIA